MTAMTQLIGTVAQHMHGLIWLVGDLRCFQVVALEGPHSAYMAFHSQARGLLMIKQGC